MANNEPKSCALENDERGRRGNDVLQRRAGRPAEIGGKSDQRDEFGDDQQKAARHFVEPVHQRHEGHDQREALG